MYVCTYVCMYACMHACMYACMHACMHVCIYVCMYVCMYIYSNIIWHRISLSSRWKKIEITTITPPYSTEKQATLFLEKVVIL